MSEWVWSTGGRCWQGKTGVGNSQTKKLRRCQLVDDKYHVDWPGSETRLLTQCSSTWKYQRGGAQVTGWGRQFVKLAAEVGMKSNWEQKAWGCYVERRVLSRSSCAIRLQEGSWRNAIQTRARFSSAVCWRFGLRKTSELSGHAARPTTSKQPQLGTQRCSVQLTPPPDLHLFPSDSTVLHKHDQRATANALRVRGDACIKRRAKQMILQRKLTVISME